MPDPSMSDLPYSQSNEGLPLQRGFSRQGQPPAGGPVPGTIEAAFIQALSGDALKVDLSVSGAPGPAGRDVAVVYLWGIQAPRPGQPFGEAATEATARLCGGKRLRVAARSAGPEARITGSVVAEGKGSDRGVDAGRALIRCGLAWQDQRGPSSAQLRAFEREARREEVGLWQQEAPTPPWAWKK